jgi:hypothetical protein
MSLFSRDGCRQEMNQAIHTCRDIGKRLIVVKAKAFQIPEIGQIRLTGI